MLEKYVFRDIDDVMTDLYGNNYAEYRRIFSQKTPPQLSLPLHLDVDVIDACNLSCSMCHQRYRKRTGAKIDPKYIEKAISESAPILASVNFGASCEPLLDKEIVSYGLDIVNKYNIMDSFIHTNGILLDEEFSRAIVDKQLKHLCISVDAASPEIYFDMRKSNKYDCLVNNINKFLKIRGSEVFPQLRLSFCKTNINISEKDIFFNLWKDIADVIDFQELRLVEGMSKDITREKNKVINQTCDPGKLRGMLWPDGTITPCCAAWSEVAWGNLASNSMSEIWNSHKANTMRNIFAGNDYSKYPQVCKMCLELE